jgi:hypothetical protein
VLLLPALLIAQVFEDSNGEYSLIVLRVFMEALNNADLHEPPVIVNCHIPYEQLGHHCRAIHVRKA